VPWRQGDQIGRIFAYWAIVFFWQFFWKLQKEPKFLGNFFSTEKAMHKIWQKRLSLYIYVGQSFHEAT
jgi:hypothetical protein